MADLARILALPPPNYIPGSAGGPPLRSIRATRGGEDAPNSLPTQRAGQGGAAQETGGDNAGAQAKRFRFRVHDGAAQNAQPTDLQRERLRAASDRPNAGATKADTRTNPLGANPLGANPLGANPAEPKALATFLAQLISQQQLGPGLHAPPVKAADLAYRRAGGESSRDIGSGARFSLAV